LAAKEMNALPLIDDTHMQGIRGFESYKQIFQLDDRIKVVSYLLMR
jgi:hypothetical protein